MLKFSKLTSFRSFFPQETKEISVTFKEATKNLLHFWPEMYSGTKSRMMIKSKLFLFNCQVFSIDWPLLHIPEPR